MSSTSPTAQSLQEVFQFFVDIAVLHCAGNTLLTQVIPHQLSVAQFSLLIHLLEHPNLKPTPVQLAEIFQVSKASIGETIKKLEAKGFVKVQPNPADGRSKTVHITLKGQQACAETKEALVPVFAKILKKVGHDSFVSVREALKQIHAGLC